MVAGALGGAESEPEHGVPDEDPQTQGGRRSWAAPPGQAARQEAGPSRWGPEVRGWWAGVVHGLCERAPNPLRVMGWTGQPGPSLQRIRKRGQASSRWHGGGGRGQEVQADLGGTAGLVPDRPHKASAVIK